jgi:hypothetical protein
MIRILLLAALLASSVPARAAATAPEDVEWSAFGHVLTLVETVVRAGMQPNPDAAMAEVLSGHNPRVNGALAGLFAEATAELPAEYRDRVASLGREIAGYAAAHPAAPAAPSARATKGNEAQVQARKDLNAMGLRYFDEGDFLDAAKRNDALAVELFVAGRGVNLGAKTWDGRTALDIARANGNTQLAELLSRNLPPAR